ncbi:hypothetical protein COCNU_13G000810 [Cocos nucifera]|uniref:BHLH domain-containing protein n=1 Tax=Cocos nucifera TaxID=13894 RepID=A0A8K0IS64_COCNU|nr:hypothetical protein COCNU_13G000810 [Cocos nucifera]
MQSLNNSNDHDTSGATASYIHDHGGIHDARYPITSSIAIVAGKETSTKKRDNNPRKRKVENISNQKVECGNTTRDGTKDKRMKEGTERGGATKESRQANSKKEASGDASKESMKPAKSGCIHVRARRGHATDSHSLAERVRRERISERMKYLQELVPGCNKITGKAGMLDEIINYVQSLQRQVEFLSMKLAAVNPRMEFNLDNLFGGEFSSCEIVRCLQASTSNLLILDQQRAGLNWQQQHQQLIHNMEDYVCNSGDLVPLPTSMQSLNNSNDHDTSGATASYIHDHGGIHDARYPITSSIAIVAGKETSTKKRDNNPRKRKVENISNQKVECGNTTRDGTKDKRMKEGTERGGATKESRQANSKKEASGDASKESMKPAKSGCIHVRARRGHATDSHSLAERVRRERISERMKYLQELVPGCNKITGKAGMLDEIINYVQSLQRQVEFLSMKLAAVNPRMEFNLDNLFGGEVITFHNNVKTEIIIEVAMADQPGRRQPFRFWYWANPPPTPRPPAPPRWPGARAPSRTPPPSAATPSPSRRPSSQPPATLRPPSPTKEASQPQKESATQEVSPAPSLSIPPVSQPESPTKKPVEPEAQDSGPTVEPETVSVDTVPGTTPTQDAILEREPKEIIEKKSVRSEEDSKKELPPVEEKPQIDTKSKQDGEPSRLPLVEEKAQIDMESKQDGESSQPLPLEKKAQIDAESKQDGEPSQLLPLEKKAQIDSESKQGTEPSQPLPEEPKAQMDMESKQDGEPSQLPAVEKKLQIDTESKQDSELKEVTSSIPQVDKSTMEAELIRETQPSHIPQEEEKSKEIVEEKPKTELEVIKKTEPEESIGQKQPSQIPREKEKTEKIDEEKPRTDLEVMEKTEREESMEEKQPSQIPQEKEKPEKIIEGKPKTDLEVIKKTEPKCPKSETACEGNKNAELKTESEARPAEKSALSGDESNDRTDIEISVAEPDFEAPEPHLVDFKGRGSTMGTRRVPWASSSHGERASFHKEINEGISKLVQKLKLGRSQQLGSESAVSIVTLAGENNGATMFVGHETTKKESVLHINKKAEASSGDKDVQKQMSNHTDGENPAIAASINSNVQGINNSLLHESSCSEEDPGVHLVLSIKPSELAKSKESVESSAASKASAK